MIGKGKSIGHIKNSISYVLSKDGANIIDKNLLIGENGKDIDSEFKIFQKQNARCEKNTFSFVLSPTIEDGQKLSVDDFKEITRDFLQEMNLQNNQYIAVLHKKNTHHIHIYCNRINTKGIAAKDNFIGKKSQQVAHEIAKKHGLVSAKDVQLTNEAKLRSVVEEAHKMAIREKPKDIYDYAEKMQKYGVKTHFKLSKANKVVGVKFQVGDLVIKGSAVNKMMSAMNLQKFILDITKSIAKSIVKGISSGL